MQVIAHFFHPLGKLVSIYDNVIIGVAVREQPAVVDVDVPIAVPVQSQIQDPLRIRLNHLFVDVTAVVVPRVPTHGRRESQTVVQSMGECKGEGEGCKGFNIRSCHLLFIISC